MAKVFAMLLCGAVSLFVALPGAHAAQTAATALPEVTVVDAYVDICPARAAARGRCEEGDPIIRVRVRIPECWDVSRKARRALGGIEGALSSLVIVPVASCEPEGAPADERGFIFAL